MSNIVLYYIENIGYGNGLLGNDLTQDKKGFSLQKPFQNILQVRLERITGLFILTFDLRVHFLHRVAILGGIGIERHRRCKTAVQRGVIMRTYCGALRRITTGLQSRGGLRWY